MSAASLLETPDLWRAAHEALLDKRWSEARSYLDELMRRPDNFYELASPTSYYLPSGDYRALLADRIDAVNAACGRNHERTREQFRQSDRYQRARSVVDAAIDESILRDQITWLSAGSDSAVFDVLGELCAGNAPGLGTREYWGVSAAGDHWRVHVRVNGGSE